MAEAKICGVTTTEALDAALAGGARFVGFVVYPRSPRHLSRDKLAAFKMALDEEHLYLGEYYVEDRPSMAENAKAIRERAGSAFSMDSLIERFKS